jgi:DNA-directed RNA polymerase subunit E'/Rpb7
MSFKDTISKQTIITSLHVFPSQVRSNINETLDKILSKKVEGYCNENGYIIKNSTQIMNRSLGKILSLNNKSKIVYDITFSGDVISPKEGDQFGAVIDSVNKMGAIAFVKYDDITTLQESPLIIILPNDYFNDSTYQLKDMNKGHKLQIEIVAVRIKYKAEQIHVVAKPV